MEWPSAQPIDFIIRRSIVNPQDCATTTEAFPFDQASQYLLRDRDRIFGAEFSQQVADLGTDEVFGAPRSPLQRAYMERVIGTIRRKCLDHLIVFNEASRMVKILEQPENQKPAMMDSSHERQSVGLSTGVGNGSGEPGLLLQNELSVDKLPRAEESASYVSASQTLSDVKYRIPQSAKEPPSQRSLQLRVLPVSL